MLNDTEVQQIVKQAESLLDKVERLEDEQARLIAVNAMRALMTLYGEGLSRIVTHAGEEPELFETFVADELISHLLLLHDLHPISAENRIRRALQELESYLQAQGASAELQGLHQGVATVHLTAGTGAVQETVQRAVLQAAPELTAVKVEEALSPARSQQSQPLVDGRPAAFVPLDTLTPLQETKSDG